MAHSVTCDACNRAEVVVAPWGPQNDWRVPLPPGWWLIAAAPAGAELGRDQQRHVCSARCAQDALRAIVATDTPQAGPAPCSGLVSGPAGDREACHRLEAWPAVDEHHLCRPHRQQAGLAPAARMIPLATMAEAIPAAPLAPEQEV
jgi:hypothetical protein